MPKIAAALCAVAVIAVGGFYAYKRSAVPAPVAEAQAPMVSQVRTTATEPAVAPEPAAPAPEPTTVAAPAPVQPATPEPLAPEPPPVKRVGQAKSETPTHSAATQAPAPKPAPVRPALASVRPASDFNETMARKVSALIAKANGYVENKQYDKAVATAENALELDPGSSAARAMISKAKARQLEALRSGSTLE